LDGRKRLDEFCNVAHLATKSSTPFEADANFLGTDGSKCYYGFTWNQQLRFEIVAFGIPNGMPVLPALWISAKPVARNWA
jgi:hypothetical protein